MERESYLYSLDFTVSSTEYWTNRVQKMYTIHQALNVNM